MEYGMGYVLGHYDNQKESNLYHTHRPVTHTESSENTLLWRLEEKRNVYWCTCTRS